MSDSDRLILKLGVFCLVILCLVSPMQRGSTVNPSIAERLVEGAAAGQWDHVTITMVPVLILAVPVGLFLWELWRERW